MSREIWWSRGVNASEHDDCDAAMPTAITAAHVAGSPEAAKAVMEEAIFQVYVLPDQPPLFQQNRTWHLSAQRERVVCAAIYVDDGKIHEPQLHMPPQTGIVFAGFRHADCFKPLVAWADLLPTDERKRLDAQIRGQRQGFVTSTGRFVDRTEAARIATVAGQWLPGRPISGWLTSEDIY